MTTALRWVGLVSVFVGLVLSSCNVEGFNVVDESLLDIDQSYDDLKAGTSLVVNLTVLDRAADEQAVCLDGTPPAYYFHPGFGSGSNNWLVNLEGGGWCNDVKTCVNRKTTRLGSSKYMDKQIAFTGILSNNAEENPDFFNWNRVRVNYCDGASFSGDREYFYGDGENKALQFRGQCIWLAVMKDLMSKGMRNAGQALLSGCSAGSLATMIHCDEFHGLFPKVTTVKCLSDAGLFMDVVDISGGHTIRNLYSGVVVLRGMHGPSTCHLDPTSCFFPQNLIDSVKTPLFILNSAYDTWQIRESLAPASADPKGEWVDCKMNVTKCSASQIEFLQGFRNKMLSAVEEFSASKQNGLFINSCFAHCQSDKQYTWYAKNSPAIGKKAIATAVGDWYFDRASVSVIDCPYPCDKTCHH